MRASKAWRRAFWEASGAVEREKQTLHGQLSEHRDRLRNLDVLLQEIQDKVRRGSDLARG